METAEKNMKELSIAWDFLDKELENFQKIVAEMEAETASSESRRAKLLSEGADEVKPAMPALSLGSKPKPPVKPKPKVPPSDTKPQLSPKPQTSPKPVFQTNL